MDIESMKLELNQKIGMLNSAIDSEYAKKHNDMLCYYRGKKRGLKYALKLLNNEV